MCQGQDDDSHHRRCSRPSDGKRTSRTINAGGDAAGHDHLGEVLLCGSRLHVQELRLQQWSWSDFEAGLLRTSSDCCARAAWQAPHRAAGQKRTSLVVLMRL